jgi:NADH-quinone oxidoreductase subunit N
MSTIITAAILGVILMMASVFLKGVSSKRTLGIIASILLLAVSIYDYYIAAPGTTYYFNNMIATSAYTSKLNILISFCVMLYFFLFNKKITKVGLYDGEYFSLILFALSGLFLITSYTNLLILFLGIEIMSIPQYVLAGSDKRSLKSNEASLKYFLMGAFSTGFLLMGITLLYGASGTFDITKMNLAALAGQSSIIALLGIFFMIIALGFKASAAPFHIWTPDVYDGTPTAFTPFMASIAKVGVFAAFIQLFQTAFAGSAPTWKLALMVVVALTLLVGNITAVYQQSVKRMLAYSSIAQAGFLLFALFAQPAMAQKSILLYGTAYMLATMGIFAVLIRLKDYTYDGFNGLAKSNPTLAFTTAICLFSLAGIPLTGGFFGKYYMLTSAMQNGMPLWLLIFAVLMAAVSVYYYFRVIMAMYFKPNNAPHSLLNTKEDASFNAMLVINAVAIIVLGILPGVATIF